MDKEEEDEDDMPLAARAKMMIERAKAAKRKRKENDDSETIMLKKHALGLRAKPTQTNATKNGAGAGAAAGGGGGGGRRDAGKNKNKTKNVAAKQEKQKNTKKAVKNGDDPEPKWHTLEHHGVVFPDLYTPHGIRPLYAGEALELNAEEEEVRDAMLTDFNAAATHYATMLETDYVSKPKFIENFWGDFCAILRPELRKKVTDFSKMDFRPIHEWHKQRSEEKKNTSKEEKKRLKDLKDEAEKKYTVAVIDGRVEKVGNFRVEPPGLFRGRGEHPKMGKIKARIWPEDITLNIGEHAAIPPCPFPGRNWGDVVHSHHVTWLAGWKDTINTDWKYVQFAASSSVKGESDREKYEKARKLKDYISGIRKDYMKRMAQSDLQLAQMAVVTYLIDKLALRAGGEKDLDAEADTVGCCSLRIEHVTMLPITPSTTSNEESNGHSELAHRIKLDFLGKDSIRYEAEHEVLPEVYEAMVRFRKGKKPDDQLFDELNPSTVNAHLKELMPGLSIKVFRTYNASITLDTLLRPTDAMLDVNAKKAFYDTANKEVAIMCNHQKGVNKSHDEQMVKMRDKVKEVQDKIKANKAELKSAQAVLKAQGGPANAKKVEKLKAAREKLDTRMTQVELSVKMKEELKTVSLGTSKINYMDPRITVAWCKRLDVPIEKMFPRTLLDKFSWAMEVEPDYAF